MTLHAGFQLFRRPFDHGLKRQSERIETRRSAHGRDKDSHHDAQAETALFRGSIQGRLHPLPTYHTASLRHRMACNRQSSAVRKQRVRIFQRDSVLPSHCSTDTEKRHRQRIAESSENPTDSSIGYRFALRHQRFSQRRRQFLPSAFCAPDNPKTCLRAQIILLGRVRLQNLRRARCDGDVGGLPKTAHQVPATR